MVEGGEREGDGREDPVHAGRGMIPARGVHVKFETAPDSPNCLAGEAESSPLAFARVERQLGKSGSGAMRVIGLMSGTSADGVDAALVEWPPGEAARPFRLLAQREDPFPAELQQRIHALAAGRCPPGAALRELAALDVALGERFAEAAIAVARDAGVALDGDRRDRLARPDRRPPPRARAPRSRSAIRRGSPSGPA